MEEAGRPAFCKADSRDWGTHLTAKRNTSCPFIWMHEYEDCFGGKSPNADPLELKAPSVWDSLTEAFKCLQKTKESQGKITRRWILRSHKEMWI